MLGLHLLLKVRWSSDKESLCTTGVHHHNLLLLSHRGQGEGFLLAWQLVKLLCSIRVSPWEEKSCSFLSLITETACSWVHDTRLVLVSWSVLYAKEIIGSKSNKSHECIPCVMVSVKSWAQQSHFTLSHCLFELCGWHIFCHILNVFLNHKKSYLSFFLPQNTLKNELKHSRLSCPLLCESAENSLGLLPICWVRNWRKFFIAHKAYV